MARNLAIKAVATSADGFYYREEHEWHGVDDKHFAWITGKMDESKKILAKYGSNKQSNQITATLSAVVDGVAQPDVVVTGLSYEEVAKFEVQWAEWYKEIATEARREASAKNAKRGYK